MSVEPVAEGRFHRVTKTGDISALSRMLAIESPIAIEYNGIGYAVMMATPSDLDDFAVGFSLTECIVGNADQIIAIDTHAAAGGHVLRITVDEARGHRVAERARQRISESGCGLCGVDSIEQALRPLPVVTAANEIDDSAIFRALADIELYQPLNRETGATHAAAFCAPDGSIVEVREDVGRHNALDKLIGALARQGVSASGGFMLVTARCSFELVQKAVLANCPLLVSISAPTSLAVERAKSHGLGLVVLARPDAILRVT